MGVNSSHYTNSGLSAYVQQNCVKLENMPPLGIIAIGIIIQTFISFLITLKPDEYIQYRSSISLKEIQIRKKESKNGTSMAGDQQTQQQITALKSDNDHSVSDIDLQPDPNIARDTTEITTDSEEEPTAYDVIMIN
eukprot:CAMPEP_0201595288 /NCGR_PEP_ID=MMETSP0190_2-20130828/192339_1 /ASSEMBLY_ACC=CAM_ASM_000263 /TAXON_ID=37353 /ORGANISM="Rosalina sp." /LENGTH=135 /DNA_ID=CAMNT_0048055219 /DNA_START=20 /DNA_END=428 /DNA_ORIENTATION=-